MRLLILSMIMVAGSMVATAQNGKVMSAFTGYTAYVSSGGAEKQELINAKDAIDQAIMDESTSTEPKTWFYKGWIEQLIYQDTSLSLKYPEAIIEAGNAYLKSLELANDPEAKKFRQKSDLIEKMGYAAGQLHNSGGNRYDQKDLGGAYKSFLTSLEIVEALKKEGEAEKLPMDPNNTRFLAAISADQLGKDDEAAKYFEELIANGYDNVYIYKGLANIYTAKGEGDKGMEILKKGSAAYPQDVSLTIDMINIYLQTGREAEGIDAMKKAIELEPDNAQLYFVLANTYGKLDNETEELAYYEKAIEVDPTYADAYNNLGAYYLDEANIYIEKMNDPSISDDEYNSLDKKRTENLDKALPYLEKAHELKPESLEIMDVLKTIYAKLGMYDKSKEIKNKMLKKN